MVCPGKRSCRTRWTCAPTSCPALGLLGDADQDFMRLAVVLDDAPLQAHGAERFAHRAQGPQVD